MQFRMSIHDEDWLVEVTSYEYAPPFRGSPHNCDSSDDYYGYEEIEYCILDLDGNPAEELEKELTKQDKVEILKELSANFKKRSENDDY